MGHSINFRELSVRPRDFTPILHASANFRQLFVSPGELCQLSLHLWDLQWTSINFPCICSNFHQVIVDLRAIPSTFCASLGPSVNSLRVAAGPSVNFWTFLELSVDIPYDRGTFRHLQSTFCAIAGVSVNFRQHSLRPRDLPSTFHAAADIPPTFLASTHPPELPSSVNKLRPQNFLSTSVDLPCICVNFSCGWGTCCQISILPVDLPSTFLASTGLHNSFHFPQLLSSSSSSRVSYPELMKYSPMILFISITQEFKQFSFL